MVRGPELEPFRLGLRALSWFAQSGWSSQAWAQAYEAVVVAFKSAEVERMVAGAKSLFNLQRWLPLAQARMAELKSEGAILGGIQRITELPTDMPEADLPAAALIALAFQGGMNPEPPPGQEWQDVVDRHPGLAAHLDLALRDLMGNDSMAALLDLFSNHPRQAALLRGAGSARLPRMNIEETAANAMGNLPGYLELLLDADDFWRTLAGRDGFWNAVRGLDLADIDAPLPPFDQGHGEPFATGTAPAVPIEQRRRWPVVRRPGGGWRPDAVDRGAGGASAKQDRGRVRAVQHS